MDDDAARADLERMLDVQRAEIRGLLDDVTEAEARARLVPSLTTLLALVTHATFVEQVWFHHRVAGRTREEVGVPETVEESFTPADDDTVAVVRERYDAACAASRAIAAEHGLHDGFDWRGTPITLFGLHVHLIQELARHAGHGDILREQLLARR